MTDELTEHGILADCPDAMLLEYFDIHGEPVHVDANRVIFSDAHGHELGEWADALGMGRGELSGRMHELAREHVTYGDAAFGGDPWAVRDPIVFDARTFTREPFNALALLLRRGCSPAEAVDWFATEEMNCSQSQWARWRGVSQQNVSRNVSEAEGELKS